MKRVFLFLALACTIVMTSCSKDDETKDVALTGINASPATFEGGVGQSVTVTLSPVPENASIANPVWNSANAAVATVDNGKITITGLGDTKVTVSSGSVSKDITVKGIVIANPVLSINVDKETVTLAVDDSVKITATPTPANADNANFEWASADTEVATVSPSGVITITGVGKTIVTVSVSNGSVKKEIAVEGTIKGIEVLDFDGRTSFDEAIVGTTMQLQVRLLPDRLNELGLIPDSWESNNPGVATVDATGLVRLTGKGTAVITVTMEGGQSATYTVGTESILNDAYGYWKFDDSLSLGQATIGSNLEIIGTVTMVDGPSASNLAVEGTQGERNFKWLHEKGPRPVPVDGEDNFADVPEYTFMWDTRFYAADRRYYSLYWNGASGDASFFTRYRESYDFDEVLVDGEDPVKQYYTNVMTIGRGAYFPFYSIEPSGDAENPALSPWMRLVVTFTVVGQDEGRYSVYVDGKPVSYQVSDGTLRYLTGHPIDSNWRFVWIVDTPIYFEADGGGGSDLEGGDGDDGVHPVAAIAVWTKALSEDEVALLGGVK